MPEPVHAADVSLSFREVSGECDLLINAEGVFATPPQRRHEHLKSIDHDVAFPWGAIAAIERRHGIVGWSLCIRLQRVAEPITLQFLYENHPASIYQNLRERFGDRAEFRSTAPPRWRPLLLPLGILACLLGGGWWVYANIDEHVQAGGEIPATAQLLYWCFGRRGILAFLAAGVAICVGMTVWYYRLSRDNSQPPGR